MSRLNKILLFIAVFIAVYFIPFETAMIQEAINEAFLMLQYYVREHVLFCLIPAFFVAGAIANFLSRNAIIKYFGAGANKILSYSVASVSGAILAVCSCTVLPLFASIYKTGAGIGPATAFLYSGPAINVLAIILTARVLGWQLGLARVIGAVFFALVIGILMAVIFRDSEEDRQSDLVTATTSAEESRSSLQNLTYFIVLVLALIFMAWAEPEQAEGIWYQIFQIRWYLTGGLLIILAVMLVKWFNKQELKDWLEETWRFTEMIGPLLFAGVLIAGFLMGRPGTEAGLIPEQVVADFVGGNSVSANFLASILGAFMYFATLTEVPILQGLMGLGMGDGPALALLLAGPALSLPNMLVIHSVLGTKKTSVFIVLVVIMATISGMIFGNLVL
ncbi:permease [Halarsenatibacter silvermanii]|uniref:Permease n=1 Tax=Halarsenatibacter silvermanii TaxID=321763 RepID=A0A1G9IVR6_9FIRM|nr:permease [Halarsenatibacter silvermanii]SDL29260.1 hypothetical protein SAMN04488692_10374 [Halarsenatibacter silvermanii]